MNITLEALDLSPEDLEVVRGRIRELAYEKWQAAGCPEDDSLHFWRLAEQQWVEHEYVPHRDDLDLRPAGQ
jgi:hypothetical protein